MICTEGAPTNIINSFSDVSAKSKSMPCKQSLNSSMPLAAQNCYGLMRIKHDFFLFYLLEMKTECCCSYQCSEWGMVYWGHYLNLRSWLCSSTHVAACASRCNAVIETTHHETMNARNARKDERK